MGEILSNIYTQSRVIRLNSSGILLKALDTAWRVMVCCLALSLRFSISAWRTLFACNGQLNLEPVLGTF